MVTRMAASARQRDENIVAELKAIRAALEGQESEPARSPTIAESGAREPLGPRR